MFAVEAIESIMVEKKFSAIQFLHSMNKILPRGKMENIVNSHFKEQSNPSLGGRKRIPTVIMLKMYILSIVYNLSDEKTEEAIYDRISFQKFMGIDPSCEVVPDKTTLCKFRLFMNEHNIQKKVMKIMNEELDEKGLILKEGAIVDATIIRAPSSTKNASQQRDPEMKSTKKRGQRFFGAKIHISTDYRGTILGVKATSASIHDSNVYEDLLPDRVEKTLGDSAYSGEPLQKRAEEKGIEHLTMKKRKKGQKVLGIIERLWNTFLSVERKFVEHAFHAPKVLWKQTKVKYRGLEKLECLWFMLAGLNNIFRLRKQLV